MSVSDPTVAPGRWGGGLSPYGMSWQKMLMWWFIVSDFLIFVGFLAAYLVTGHASFLAATLFDGVTCVAFVYFAHTARVEVPGSDPSLP